MGQRKESPWKVFGGIRGIQDREERRSSNASCSQARERSSMDNKAFPSGLGCMTAEYCKPLEQTDFESGCDSCPGSTADHSREAGADSAAKQLLREPNHAHETSRGGKWGLPTPTCQAMSTPYLLNGFPAQHEAWRRAGRVMAACFSAGGLGDYFRQLPAAFVVALGLEMALVQCDQQEYLWRDFIPMNLSQYIRRYFDGAHFSWYGTGAIQDEPIRLHGGAFLRSYQRWPNDTGIRVRFGGPVPARRAYMMNRVKLAPLMGNLERASEDVIEGCILRYLLAPSAHLKRLARKSGAGPAASPAGLLHAVAMHARLGDSAFYRPDEEEEHLNQRTETLWPWLAEERANIFRVDPRRGFRCLLRASAMLGADPAAPARAKAGRCCIVVSDSGDVGQCARQALRAPLIVKGRSLQIVGSPASAFTEENEDKVFLDWWLLARSAGTLSFGSSSFVNTAVRFRQASSSQGFEIRAWDVQALLSDEWERACDVERPWNFTRRVCEEKLKDYWGLGCRKDPFW